MAFLRCVVVVLFVVSLVAVSAAAGRRDKKKKKDSVIDEINKRVDAIEDRIKAAHGSHGSDGSCAGNNVHFFFHGDEDAHGHSHHDDDTHVHVHISDHDSGHHGDDDHFHHEHVAICSMNDGTSGIQGTVQITQADNERSADFHFHFENLEADTDYDFHVHQFGVDDCGKVGMHYNPYHKDVDVGDLGTFRTDGSGSIDAWNNDTHLTTFGEYCIMGRSIMIHAPDGTVACCIIGVSPETHDHNTDHSHEHEHFSHDHNSHEHHGHEHSSHDHHGHDHHSHSHH